MKENWIVNQFIAHRGLFNNKDVPENSLLAFKKAIEKNYAIEFDVYLLDDGSVAVFHDLELNRMTGKNGYISLLTKEDLKQYKLLKTEETIPTLEEVLEAVRGQVPILVELKSSSLKNHKLEEAAYNILKNYDGEYAIQSFNPYNLEWFKINAPKVPRGIIGTYWKQPIYGRPKSVIIRMATKRLWLYKKGMPNFISYDFRDLPNHFVSKHKVPILAWGIKSQQDYLSIVKHADNIIFEGFEPKI